MAAAGGDEAWKVTDFSLVNAVTLGGECWEGILAQLCLLPSLSGSSWCRVLFLVLCSECAELPEGHSLPCSDPVGIFSLLQVGLVPPRVRSLLWLLVEQDLELSKNICTWR